MLTKKESLVIISSALVLSYVVIFSQFTFNKWAISFLLALLLLITNTAGKKLTAFLQDSNATVHHWTIEKYWWDNTGLTKGHFNKPMPAWIIFPILFSLLSGGFIKLMTLITFEASALPSKSRKTFANITEKNIALIAAGGLLFNIILAFISHSLGFKTFANLNLLYVLVNLIPISNLDGTKIFFGSLIFWIFSLIFAISVFILLDISGLIATIILAILIATSGVFLFYYLTK